MNNLNVSIVLPVYNSEKMLSLCLDSLISLDYPKENIEIIVVDNNSTDKTKDIISRYKVKYLFERKKGAPAALNRGIQSSSAEIIAFTHSDCVVDRNWIMNIAQGFAEDNIGGCGGSVFAYNPRSSIERYCKYRKRYFQNGNIAKDDGFLPWIMLANAAFQRNALQEVGLLDKFFTEEYDIDLSWRIHLKGYQFKYIPDAIVYHKYRDTLIGLWRQCFKIGYNSPRFAKKYGEIYESLYVVPHKNILYICREILYGFYNFFEIFFIKKKRQKAIFILLDNVVYFAFFLGGMHGWLRLKLIGILPCLKQYE